MILRVFFRGSALLLTIVGACFNLHSQPMFQPLVVQSNRVQIVLLGNSGSKYAIENSSNLSNWTTLFSATASNGRIEFSGPLPSVTAQFFRGRPDTNSAAPIDITPQIETNRTAEVFATMDGGSTVLFANDGTKFDLTFPSNNVVTPTTISMTLITNVTGLPFAGGLIGAVTIGPDDPDLFGAGKLTITFSTNIDRRHIASFTANADGSSLALTPDRVVSNTVTIPITHSGVFGAAIATTQELAQVSQSVSASTAPLLFGKKSATLIARAPMPTSILCFPDEVAEAVRIRNEIQAALREVQSNIAIIIEVERQKQIFGVESDTSEIFAEAGPLTCKFYNEQIAPHWPQAANNCSLMNVLLQFGLGLDRQMQLLGVPDEERCTANLLSPQNLCPGFKACMNEIKNCCLAGHQEAARLHDLVSLVRQQSLLGIEGRTDLGCFDLQDTVTENVIDACTKSIWRGTISLKEDGDSDDRTNYSDGYDELTTAYHFSATAFATNSTEQIIDGLGLMATVNFAGNATVRSLRDDYAETDTKCGVFVRDDKSEASGDANVVYMASISEQSTNYSLMILFLGSGDGQGGLTAQQRNERVNTTGPTDIGCVGIARQFSSSESQTQFASPQLAGFTGPLTPGETNNITGSADLQGFFGSKPTKIIIKWDLTRSKVQ